MYVNHGKFMYLNLLSYVILRELFRSKKNYLLVTMISELLSIYVHFQGEFFHSKSLQQNGLILYYLGRFGLGC